MHITIFETFVERRYLSVASALGLFVVATLVRSLAKGYNIRKKYRNLPGPPGHSWLWGHLKVMGEVATTQPYMSHPHSLCLLLKEKHSIQTRYFYVDLWPFADPIFYVFDPDIAAQITVEREARKHKAMQWFMSILAGPEDMVSSDGPVWKKWRSVFNPGFAASHLMTLVPMVVDASVVFTEKMREYAGEGNPFRMEEDATRLTVDIIGRMTLDTNLDTQRGDNPFVTALREQVHLLPNNWLNPFSMYTPAGIYKRWRNNRIMNEYIGNLLEERFSQRSVQEKTNTGTEKKSGDKQRARAIIDLALETYLEEKGIAPPTSGPPKMDETFKAKACVHIRTFMFAGHDTTSSTICYAAYMLSKNPKALARLRAEHDQILGPVSTTAETIKTNPHILNKLEYTLAVTKEVLRLFPPTSSTRAGDRNLATHDPQTGQPLPTEGALIWIVHHAMHRDESLFGPSAKLFLPERFLPENSHLMPENAWRPFEKGARNCIGQDLALIETKVILALLAREFDFEADFGAAVEGGGGLARDGSFFAKDPRFREGGLVVDGEEAFQVLIGTAKPREGMPMRVKVA
ncbi:hypothetical protein MBLNU230_g2777t1 [Neophaeotheca triangularis]